MTELLSTQKEQRESLKREGATLREAKGSESWVQFLRHDHCIIQGRHQLTALTDNCRLYN